MGRPTELTKKELMRLGITKVTEDGQVFIGDRILKSYIQSKPSRFKTQQYRVVRVYDPKVYQAQKAANGGKCIPGKTIGLRGIVLSRLMYAWHRGIAPANMDVDHKDGNSLNDHISNLQLLSRQENLAKRKGHMNQYAKSYRE